MWEAPPSGGVEPSHESQDKYTTFYLQFQRFFNESHALADYIPNLKEGALSARLVMRKKKRNADLRSLRIKHTESVSPHQIALRPLRECCVMFHRWLMGIGGRQ